MKSPLGLLRGRGGGAPGLLGVPGGLWGRWRLVLARGRPGAGSLGPTGWRPCSLGLLPGGLGGVVGGVGAVGAHPVGCGGSRACATCTAGHGWVCADQDPVLVLVLHLI